jgi:hypothetical protein
MACDVNKNFGKNAELLKDGGHHVLPCLVMNH